MKRLSAQEVIRAFRKEQAALLESNENIMVKIGKKVESLRKDNGMSREELSAVLNRGRMCATNIENGQRKISILELVKIAHALGVDPAELLPTIDEIRGTT